MAQTKYTDGSGVAEIWANIKNYITAQLLGKSDTGHTHVKSEITDFPAYGNTAGTICEGNDSRLSNARTPIAHTHTASDITSGLATVATSGSYNDLSNKPTIPTVNNATLTIQKNGTTVKTFTANASSNVTCNITVPTKTSDLTNDSGFLTSHQDLSGYVPRSGGAVMTGMSLAKTTNDSYATYCGGNSFDNGAFVRVHGKDFADPYFAGTVIIRTLNDVDLFLKPDGTATWDGKAIDTIEEQGNGYIRYSNGIQICWGLGIYDDNQTVSYAKAFNENPSIVASMKGNATNWHPAYFIMSDVSSGRNYVSWQAIGRWK